MKCYSSIGKPKKAFDTEAEAKDFLVCSQTLWTYQNLETYCCPECGKFHNGTKNYKYNYNYKTKKNRWSW